MDSTAYLNNIKKQIREVTPTEVKERLDAKKDFVLIDVREPHEVSGVILPGAQPVVRGFLELKIGNMVSDINKEIILYCAGGNRSALSAKALQDMGYKNVL